MEFAVVSGAGKEIQGHYGQRSRGWQTIGSAAIEGLFTVSRTSETGVLLFRSWDQSENSA